MMMNNMNGMNGMQPSDLYYDHASGRSPTLQRQQQHMLPRSTSRQFDGYGSMPTNDMFAGQEQTLRYDTNRYDRMNVPVPGATYGYDTTQAQTWNQSGFNGNNQYAPNYAANTRRNPPMRGRSALPNTWLDQQQLANQMSYGGIGPSPLGPSQRGSDAHDMDDELIPTAIVIKNIPFAVRKEQLVELMTNMNLPLPYAFNYHFDSGVFRGLAFANFTSAEETGAVIEHLNHYDLNGRRLRVEYKKMLPLQERERIEREKRERRGQLEEQHRPVGGQLHNHPSMSSMASHRPPNTPSPTSASQHMPDLNDKETLEFYNQLFSFKEDYERESLILPSTLTPSQRRCVHTLAHHMQLGHSSRGNGEQRQVHVYRANRPSPPMGNMNTIRGGDAMNRPLNRAATFDFEQRRGVDHGNYVLRGQQSSGLLGIPDSPIGFGINQNLRTAKSVADLRSFTPSPVTSGIGLSQNGLSNGTRYQDYVPSSNLSNTPTLTPTTTNGPFSQATDTLVNGFEGLTLNRGTNGSNGESPRRLRPLFPYVEEGKQPPSGPSTAGAIGSNRSVSMNHNHEASSRERGLPPVRQPLGPSDRGSSAFSRGRQNGHQQRGSDEMRQQANVGVIFEDEQAHNIGNGY